MGQPDYYAVLGVARDASTDDIRRAYVARARLLHPDTVGIGEGDGGRAMQLVNAAWWVLRDPGRRANHDRELGVAPRPGATPDPFRPAGGGAGDPDERHVPVDAQHPEPGPIGRAGDLLLFIPPAFLFGALACFALGMLMFNASLLGIGIVMLLLSGVSFVVAPFAALARDRRALRRSR